MKFSIRVPSFGSLGIVVLALLIMSTLSIMTPATAYGQSAEVTFTKDVAPILQGSCQTCHRDGAIAPMSLMTYEETRPWARAIKDKVSTRTMPPWYIDKNVGVQGFKYDRSLSDDQIATLVAWVDAGAPRGNPGDMPPSREFADRDRWHIGEPDLIIPIPEPFVVPAEGANWWGDFFSDSGLTEDRWIKAVETKPSAEGFPVVHHAVTRLQETEDADTGDFLNEYAQGKNGDVFPPGTGRLVKAGSIIRFNLHYASIGKDTTDRTSVGLTLYPKGEEPEKELFSRALAQNFDLDIPPGQDNVRHDSYHPFTTNIPPDRVPAPPPQSREASVHRGDLARRQHRDNQLRHPGTSAGTSSTTTPTTCSRCCRRGQCSTPSRGTTTRPPTGGTPIRGTGPASVSGRATT